MSARTRLNVQRMHGASLAASCLGRVPGIKAGFEVQALDIHDASATGRGTREKGSDLTVERFSASNAARHIACPASANLDLAIPGWVKPIENRNEDNAANRGTLMHELFAKITELPAREMAAAAEAIAYVAELRSTRRFKVLIEQSIKATWLTSEPDTTVDLVLYTQDEIHVIDWKWGKVRVEVTDNAQLMYYALCFAPLAPKAKGVTLHIVQPNADNMNSWFADTATLATFMGTATKTEKLLLSGDVTFGPSDNCFFCPANPHSRGQKGTPLCPTMLGMLYPPLMDTDEILNF